jgi:hypothetical protein
MISGGFFGGRGLCCPIVIQLNIWVPRVFTFIPACHAYLSDWRESGLFGPLLRLLLEVTGSSLMP